MTAKEMKELKRRFIDKTPNGWSVPLRDNESRWTLPGILSEVEQFYKENKENI